VTAVAVEVLTGLAAHHVDLLPEDLVDLVDPVVGVDRHPEMMAGRGRLSVSAIGGVGAMNGAGELCWISRTLHKLTCGSDCKRWCLEVGFGQFSWCVNT